MQSRLRMIIVRFENDFCFYFFLPLLSFWWIDKIEGLILGKLKQEEWMVISCFLYIRGILKSYKFDKGKGCYYDHIFSIFRNF